MSWGDWSAIALAVIVLMGLLVAAIFLAYGIGFNPLSIVPQEAGLGGNSMQYG